MEENEGPKHYIVKRTTNKHPAGLRCQTEVIDLKRSLSDVMSGEWPVGIDPTKGVPTLCPVLPARGSRLLLAWRMDGEQGLC